MARWGGQTASTNKSVAFVSITAFISSLANSPRPASSSESVSPAPHTDFGSFSFFLSLSLTVSFRPAVHYLSKRPDTVAAWYTWLDTVCTQCLQHRCPPSLSLSSVSSSFISSLVRWTLLNSIFEYSWFPQLTVHYSTLVSTDVQLFTVKLILIFLFGCTFDVSGYLPALSALPCASDHFPKCNHFSNFCCLSDKHSTGIPPLRRSSTECALHIIHIIYTCVSFCSYLVTEKIFNLWQILWLSSWNLHTRKNKMMQLIWIALL